MKSEIKYNPTTPGDTEPTSRTLGRVRGFLKGKSQDEYRLYQYHGIPMIASVEWSCHPVRMIEITDEVWQAFEQKFGKNAEVTERDIYVWCGVLKGVKDSTR